MFNYLLIIYLEISKNIFLSHKIPNNPIPYHELYDTLAKKNSS